MEKQFLHKYLLLVVCAFSFLAGQAQVKVGIRSGFTVAGLVGPDVHAYDAKLSFYAAGFANVPLFDAFSLQPEIQYSRQGACNDHEGPVTRERLNYLNVPLLARYQSRMGLYAETGPQFGFLINAQRKDNAHLTNVNGSYRPFDFSWVWGAGYRITQRAGVDLRWNLGMTDVSDYPGTVRNSVWQIGLAYTLGTFH
ncbi:porin family protein [Paraflavitalea sp. CAU 1676]|uniref:porin family protein n=1 Tax=Paraflavitalea sp. CAU 1676 TaxID=3032598 RepID=UPI0023D9930C|nr:porin family protein [Paraflavitalea sp. CAU 1676]